MSESEQLSGGNGIDSTAKLVGFEHPFFRKVEDLRFQLDEEGAGSPVAIIKLAGKDAVLTLAGIQREFSIIDDSPDGRMLDMLARSLKFVKGLRIGDPIPPEILTRKASWSILPRHREIAFQRLVVRMVGWLTGEDQTFASLQEMQKLTEDETFKKNVNVAFTAIAEKLGLPPERKDEVTHLIQTLADELAFIEAMRDRFSDMLKMEQKIQKLRHLYGSERSVLDIADPVARLMGKATAQFKDLFDQIDAQTGEIVSVLSHLDSQIHFIRDMRDDLHVRIMAWDEILEIWSLAQAKKSPGVPDLLRKTYHFLAPRYMPTQEWVLMTKRMAGEKTKKLGGQMTW